MSQSIGLAAANSVCRAALAKAAELKLKPLTVAVLDAGGHVIASQRQDGSSTLRLQIACAKAAGALGLGMSSRRIAEMAAERSGFVAALAPISPYGVVPAAGGLIVVNAEGVPIGAVGISGDTSDNDELCASAGIAAAGLSAQPEP